MEPVFGQVAVTDRPVGKGHVGEEALVALHEPALEQWRGEFHVLEIAKSRPRLQCEKADKLAAIAIRPCSVRTRRLSVIVRAVVPFAVLMALCASHAIAAEVEIERMTSPEVRAAIEAGKTTIIIPTGGTEQNGPHMVLGKHNFIVRETARRIAEKLGNALVAPVLGYVPEGDIEKREGHMAYAGTISVPPPVFAAVLEAAADSFRAHGFKTIVLLGDSGPNQEPQRILARQLSRAWAAKGVRVLSPDSYYGANGAVDWLKGAGRERGRDRHACRHPRYQRADGGLPGRRPQGQNGRRQGWGHRRSGAGQRRAGREVAHLSRSRRR